MPTLRFCHSWHSVGLKIRPSGLILVRYSGGCRKSTRGSQYSFPLSLPYLLSPLLLSLYYQQVRKNGNNSRNCVFNKHKIRYYNLIIWKSTWIIWITSWKNMQMIWKILSSKIGFQIKLQFSRLYFKMCECYRGTFTDRGGGFCASFSPSCYWKHLHSIHVFFK